MMWLFCSNKSVGIKITTTIEGLITVQQMIQKKLGFLCSMI
jgi:hypothetical protein